MANLIVIRNEYRDDDAVRHVVDYILRHTVAWDGYGLSPNYPMICMQGLKQAWHKDSGSRLNHYIFSLSPQEENCITINDLLSFGAVFSKNLMEFQTVYAVHANSHHLHLHVVMNTVSFLSGHKYSGGLIPLYQFRDYLRNHYPRFRHQIYYSYPNTVNEFNEEDCELLEID